MSDTTPNSVPAPVQRKRPLRVQQANPDAKYGRLVGAAGSDLCDCHDLAKEAWGEEADGEATGIASFAYLWRRFGPPFWGTDSHKRLAGYVLTTAEPDVFLSLDPSGSPLTYCVGYLVKDSVEKEFRAPETAWHEKYRKWCEENEIKEPWAESSYKRAYDAIGEYPRDFPESWRSGPPVMQRVNAALLRTMTDLLRPVSIRDVSINILGHGDGRGRGVEPSRFAGYGVPYKAMCDWIKPAKAEGRAE